ncbi:ExbD/TolR family protein [Tropicibacter alexandrii]|uniref:ExbD/TolR family protein n=1 Tax=Tropicibacter alexandrii TaxID=2267683 RepID=UPI0010092602|nr:biopolymer transporter ExbD [Tropicibacter alexandrii]
MLDLPARPTRRRPSLTPMIDVVFLLLVFFMLAARFGLPLSQPIRLAAPGGEAPYQGPPRLVTVTPQGALLNGVPVDDLPAALSRLMAGPTDTVLLRATEGTSTQALLDVLTALRAAGLTGLAIVE